MHLKIRWDDIDPTVFIDDDRQAYLCWGEATSVTTLNWKIMIELDGQGCPIDCPVTTEAPWIHKRGAGKLPSITFPISERSPLCYEP